MNPFHRLHSLRMENDAAGMAMDELRPRFQAMANRHANGTAPHAVSAYQLFQTPMEVARYMAESLCLVPGVRILEPSAGLGRLIDAASLFQARVTAVEVAPQLCRELYTKYPEVKLYQRDFLAMDPEGTGLFDYVMMNPPFHMRSDIKHVLHARRFLKPGGVLCSIVMNTVHRREALGGIAGKWEDLPAATFKESGTHVETSIVWIYG